MRKGIWVMLAGLVLVVGVGVAWFFLTVKFEIEDRRVSGIRLKQIGIAMHNYHGNFNSFPAAAICDTNGKPLLSWRVSILPFIEQDHLYRQFKLDEPWDGPTNKPLLANMPQIYAPVRGRTAEPNCTYYRVLVGPKTLFEDYSRKPRFADITDGSSNTFLAVEAGEAVPWTKPEELTYDPNQPLPKLGGMFNGNFVALFCDCSVRFIPKTMSEANIRAYITASGNEPIAADGP